jgi:hypothetical protein
VSHTHTPPPPPPPPQQQQQQQQHADQQPRAQGRCSGTGRRDVPPSPLLRRAARVRAMACACMRGGAGARTVPPVPFSGVPRLRRRPGWAASRPATPSRSARPCVCVCVCARVCVGGTGLVGGAAQGADLRVRYHQLLELPWGRGGGGVRGGVSESMRPAGMRTAGTGRRGVGLGGDAGAGARLPENRA